MKQLQVNIFNGSSNEIELTSGGTVKSELVIKNTTSQNLKDMDVKVAFSSNLTPDANITEEIEDNVALSGVETGKDGISIMTLKVNSINAGDSLKIEMFPSTQYSLGENKTEDVWMLAEVITSNKNSYISNKCFYR